MSTALHIFIEFDGADYALMVADDRMSPMPAGYPPCATLDEAETKADKVRAMLAGRDERRPSKAKQRHHAAA